MLKRFIPYFIHFECLPDPIESLDELPGGADADFYCPDCSNSSLGPLEKLKDQDGGYIDISDNDESMITVHSCGEEFQTESEFKRHIKSCKG